MQSDRNIFLFDDVVIRDPRFVPYRVADEVAHNQDKRENAKFKQYVDKQDVI